MEPRPYYHRFAWAYDLLQSQPITARISFIVGELQARDVWPPKLVLDAGCGTGRYSAELASKGFIVIGVDQSPELIKIARERRVVSGEAARYEVCNLLAFDAPRPLQRRSMPGGPQRLHGRCRSLSNLSEICGLAQSRRGIDI